MDQVLPASSLLPDTFPSEKGVELRQIPWVFITNLTVHSVPGAPSAVDYEYIFKRVAGIFLNDPWSYFCLISFNFPPCLSLIFPSREDGSSFSSLLSGRWVPGWLETKKTAQKKSRRLSKNSKRGWPRAERGGSGPLPLITQPWDSLGGRDLQSSAPVHINPSWLCRGFS